MSKRMDERIPNPSSSHLESFPFRLYLGAYSFIKPFLTTFPILDTHTRKIRRSILSNLYPNRLIKENIPNPYSYHGLIIHYRPNDEGDFQIILSLARGGYEEETVRVLSDNLYPGQTFVDLGAHIGIYSLLAAQMVNPGGRIFAFEPDSNTIPLLEIYAVNNKMRHLITIIPKAVYSSSGKVFLFRFPGRSESSSLNPRKYDQERVEIETTDLDHFFASMNWPAVDFIKMDVEGSEKAALEGMRQLIKRNQNLKLIMEINNNRIMEAGNTLAGIMDFLIGIGFSSFRVLHPGWGYITAPRDIPRFLRLVKQYNVNLLCEIQ